MTAEQWPDAVLDALAGCPNASLRWAAAGYRAGWQDRSRSWEDGFRAGYAQSEQDMADAWVGVAQRVREGAADPQFQDLEQIRSTVDGSPCAVDCGTCSRCICAAAFRERGGRAYAGLEAEAAIARGAA